MSKIDVKSLLESLKVQPNDYRPIDDQEDDSSKYSLGNGATDIYLVKDKYNKVFIKKEFKIDSTYEANNSSSNSSIDSTGVINSVDDDDDSDKFDFGSYQSSDSDISPTNTIKYFQREVENLIKVQIKGLPFLNIIGYNFQVGENQPFIITKQMKGDTLKHLIDTNFEKCSNKSTIQMIIFYGVVFALKYLHKIKVIHRDIKPANIFLNEKYEPFLGDFGFARVIQESTKLTENIGTTFYMAEELINNDSELKPSEKIDSYSFAVTVLETLTLDLTIQNTDGKILSKNKKDCECLDENTFRTLTSKGKKYIIPEEVPFSFKKLIEECWSENSDERWPMEKIVEMMENKELEIPGYEEDKFFEYVNKLKEAERINEPIRFTKKKRLSTKKVKPSIKPA